MSTRSSARPILPFEQPSYEPLPFEEEIEFILDTAGQYLSRPPTRSDILSIYAGIRPLVKADGAVKQDRPRSPAITPSISMTPDC